MTDEAIYELAREIAAEEGKGDRETYIEMLQNRLKWAIDTLEEIHEEYPPIKTAGSHVRQFERFPVENKKQTGYPKPDFQCAGLPEPMQKTEETKRSNRKRKKFLKGSE